MIDFHSHILPAMDDGASDAHESILMLGLLQHQNVDQIVATPHYYGEDLTIAEFIEKRQESYNLLQEEMLKENFTPPNINLGAEVYLNPETAEDSDLYKLCITGTNVILLEMPFDTWYDWEYHAVYKIIAQHNLRPVIAHIERYFQEKSDFPKIERLLNLEVISQINASSLLERKSWKFIKWLLKTDNEVVLGSDIHNMTIRKSQMDVAINKLIKVFGEDKINRMIHTAKRLLS